MKNRLILAFLLLLLLIAVGIGFTPRGVAGAVRGWIWWKARQQGLRVEMGRIEAPLLRPVLIRDFRLTSKDPAPFQLNFIAPQVTVGLNLRALFSSSSGRMLRFLAVERLQAEIHRDAAVTSTPFDWKTIVQLFPDNFHFANTDLRVENGNTVVLFRGVELSASQIEAGRFVAREVMISSPLFRQSFTNLRGAANWQDARLTLGALNLSRGLDIEAVSADLSRLEKRRLGLDLNLDAFGGQLRASVASESHADHQTWNVAGSASRISLAQLSEALGLTDPADGQVRAAKFTFHGNPRDFVQATTSVWMEVNDLKWRQRTVDVLMLGASLYNRQLLLQQLYLKQRRNEVTLSGESALPRNAAEWFSSNFRSDISANIENLGDFAELFGAQRPDFAGTVTISGTIGANNGQFAGEMTAGGKSLRIFKTPVESMAARLQFEGNNLELETFELRRGEDFVRASGRLSMAGGHDYSGVIEADVSNVTEILSMWGAAVKAAEPLSLELKITAVTRDRARLDWLHLTSKNIDLPFWGEITKGSENEFAVTLRANAPTVASIPEGIACAAPVAIAKSASAETAAFEIDSIKLLRAGRSEESQLVLLKDDQEVRRIPLCHQVDGPVLTLSPAARN